MKTATCRKCGEQIFWAKTKQSKNMALDVEPSSEGRFAIEDEDGDPKVSRMSGAAADEYTGPLYTCHFETCNEGKAKETREPGDDSF